MLEGALTVFAIIALVAIVVLLPLVVLAISIGVAKSEGATDEEIARYICEASQADTWMVG